MYEETRNSIDWKGLFLKDIIAFLIVFIAVKGYTMLKGNDKSKNTQITTTKETVADSKKDSTIFTENLEKLREAGEKYFKENPSKVPTTVGNTTMVTLNDLVANGTIKALRDEDGKTCNGESSYVAATKEEGDTKIKANLVCGDSASYALVYMDENTGSETKTYSYSNTTTENGNGGKTTSSCGSSSCAPSISVNTSNKIENTITTGGSSSNKGNSSSSSSNSNSNTNKNRYYTVSFDRNGGTIGYPNQTVKYYNTVAYPGSNQKSGCTFRGWYLNGVKYDFNTPVTSNITLTAMYDCSYNYNSNNNNYNRYDDEIEEDTFTSYVYTMGWDTYGTDYVKISHTLQLPEELDDNDVIEVKISDINFYKSLNTKSLAQTYGRLHSDTFYYEPNGWEADITSANSLATIKSNAVDFRYSSRYKDIEDALDDGFDVVWTADDVYSQCKTTFSVNGVNNLCGYGIVYKVEWTYKYYR